MPSPQEPFDVARRAVANAHPNHLGRRAEQEGKVVEVAVLADDREFMCSGVFPDNRVRGIVKSYVPYVNDVGPEIA